MIFKTKLRRAYERRLRDQGNAKAWAIKQASLATILEMLNGLPLRLQLKIFAESLLGIGFRKS